MDVVSVSTTKVRTQRVPTEFEIMPRAKKAPEAVNGIDSRLTATAPETIQVPTEPKPKARKGKARTDRVAVSAPKMLTAIIPIVGTTHYCQNAFSQKQMDAMKKKQEQGSQSEKNKKKEPKDFEACYEGAKHRSEEGWLGIPATAFRSALVSACRLVGFKMTHAKLGLYVCADGYDKHDLTPLIRITEGEPERRDHAVRNESGVADIRPRPFWAPGWKAVVRLEFDGDMFSTLDISHLMMRVGRQVGIGEGRPDSRNSCGMGWGLFRVDGDVHLLEGDEAEEREQEAEARAKGRPGQSPADDDEDDD